MARQYFVYIMSNRRRTLYVGVTNNLLRRLREHRKAGRRSFTGRYLMSRLVYFEQFATVALAIAREKQIKGRRRSKKVALIEGVNPGWDDLSSGWLEDGDAK